MRLLERWERRPRRVGIDLYYLNEPALVEMVQYTCVPVDDLGVAHPENGVPRMNWLNGSLAADCSAPSAARSCGSAALDWALSDCGPGHVIDPCTMTCQDGQSSGCGLQTDDSSTDYCTAPFTYMGASAKQLATMAFGPDGYSIELIAFDPSSSCMLGQGQSYATTRRMLVEGNDDVFPICGDYAPALENVRAFATAPVNTEQPLTLRPNETIEAVSVVSKSGTKRELLPARYSYEREAGVLHLMAADLGADDVSIEIVPPSVAPDKVRRSIADALERQADRRASAIDLDIRNGHVSLSGVVRSWQEREAVVGAVRGTSGVRSVEDHLRIEPYAG